MVGCRDISNLYNEYYGAQFTVWLQDVPGAFADFLEKTGIDNIVAMCLMSCVSFVHINGIRHWGKLKQVKFNTESPEDTCKKLTHAGYEVGIHAPGEEIDMPRSLNGATVRPLVPIPLSRPRDIPRAFEIYRRYEILILSIFNLSLFPEDIRLAVSVQDSASSPNVNDQLLPENQLDDFLASGGTFDDPCRYLSGQQFQPLVDIIDALERDFRESTAFQVNIDPSQVGAMQDLVETLANQSIYVQSPSVVSTGNERLVTLIPHETEIEQAKYALSEYLGYQPLELPILEFNVSGGADMLDIMLRLREFHVGFMATIPRPNHDKESVTMRITCNKPEVAKDIFR